jgi:hypothetical protein
MKAFRDSIAIFPPSVAFPSRESDIQVICDPVCGQWNYFRDGGVDL